MSVYGNLNIDTDLLFIRFVYKEKLNFEKIEFHSNISSVRSSSYEEQTVSNHYHYI